VSPRSGEDQNDQESRSAGPRAAPIIDDEGRTIAEMMAKGPIFGLPFILEPDNPTGSM